METRCTIPARIEGRPSRPEVFIVGAPKCGTTAMSDYLGAHPDIFMARKEMHVFGSDLMFRGHFYRRNFDAYLREFSPANGRRRAGEASVWYLYSERAAEEINAFNPEAKIIIMLREPTEMMYSLYSQFRFDGNEQLGSFEEALAAERDRRAGRRICRRAYLPQGLLYRDVARYAGQVRRYLEIFGSRRVHVILYDDFAADTAGTYRKALEFLGVDPCAASPDFKVINGNKAPQRSFLQTVCRDPLVCSAALAIRPWLPPGIFSALQRADARLRHAKVRPATRPPLAVELRSQLKREFAPEIEQLGRLIERDLSAWNRDFTPSPRIRASDESKDVTYCAA